MLRRPTALSHTAPHAHTLSRAHETLRPAAQSLSSTTSTSSTQHCTQAIMGRRSGEPGGWWFSDGVIDTQGDVFKYRRCKNSLRRLRHLTTGWACALHSSLLCQRPPSPFFQHIHASLASLIYQHAMAGSLCQADSGQQAHDACPPHLKCVARPKGEITCSHTEHAPYQLTCAPCTPPYDHLRAPPPSCQPAQLPAPTHPPARHNHGNRRARWGRQTSPRQTRRRTARQRSAFSVRIPGSTARGRCPEARRQRRRPAWHAGQGPCGWGEGAGGME